MDFYNSPYYNSYGAPTNQNGQPQFSGYQQIPNQALQQTTPQPKPFEMPQITTGGVKFTVKKNPEDALPIPVSVEDTIAIKTNTGKRRGRPPKNELAITGTTEIARSTNGTEKATGTVESVPTAYTYYETSSMLRDTLGQIDELGFEMKQDLEEVRRNRTMKGKYNYMIGMSANLGALLSTRISTIKEINNSITKSNDLDYRREKDNKAAQSAVNDDSYIMDLYNAYISNPLGQNSQLAPAAIDYTALQPTSSSTGIIRSDIESQNSNGMADTRYLNYLSNMTPEQNLMRYEANPNVKQVVVFDQATGNKTFQMMDLGTGRVIDNVPVYDQMFMADTTIDLNNKIAKNINLNETFPLIVIGGNDSVSNQY